MEGLTEQDWKGKNDFGRITLRNKNVRRVLKVKPEKSWREYAPAGLKEKVESAYKPGSVENSHSSRLQVTLQLKQSTQEPRGPRVCPSI